MGERDGQYNGGIAARTYTYRGYTQVQEQHKKIIT